jgi:hypothetical protein
MTLTKEDIQVTLAFLARADLKGAEAPSLVHVVNQLKAYADSLEKATSGADETPVS